MVCTVQLNEVTGVPVQNCRADIGNRTDDCAQFFGFHFDIVVTQQLNIVAFTFRNGAAGCNNVVLLYIYHCILLNQLRSILQRHKVGGLTGNIQQQREGCFIAELLYCTLCRAHCGNFCRTCNGIVLCFLGSLVYQNEAYIGFVTADGSNACVHPNVIIQRDIVVTGGSHGNLTLTENRVQEALVIQTMVIVLFSQQFRRINAVNPSGYIRHIIVNTFTGHCIGQHCTNNIFPTEQTDGSGYNRCYPVGMTFFIDFEVHTAKQLGGILETQVTINVTEEVLTGGIANAVFHTFNRYFLCGHVNNNIRRNTVHEVIQPFERVTVIQEGHTYRLVIQVNLSGGIVYFKLADQIAQFAQLAVCQHLCRGRVQHGNLVVGNFRYVSRKITCLRNQQFTVGSCSENRQTCYNTQRKNRSQNNQHCQGHFHAEYSQICNLLGLLISLTDYIAVFIHIQIIFRPCTVLRLTFSALFKAQRAREHSKQAAPYYNGCCHKNECIGIMNVQRRQGEVKIYNPQNQRNNRRNQEAANGFSFNLQ